MANSSYISPVAPITMINIYLGLRDGRYNNLKPKSKAVEPFTSFETLLEAEMERLRATKPEPEKKDVLMYDPRRTI